MTRFRSFIRSLNVFATITTLRVELATSQRLLASSYETAHFLKLGRDNYGEMAAKSAIQATKRGKRLAQHAQAIDAFMDEREDLKAALANAKTFGTEALAVGVTLKNALDHFAERAVAAEALVLEQASEIVEVVSWVRAVEEALGFAGISIADDGQNGPAITVDGAKFRQAAEADLIDLVLPVAQAA